MEVDSTLPVTQHRFPICMNVQGLFPGKHSSSSNYTDLRTTNDLSTDGQAMLLLECISSAVGPLCRNCCFLGDYSSFCCNVSRPVVVFPPPTSRVMAIYSTVIPHLQLPLYPLSWSRYLRSASTQFTASSVGNVCVCVLWERKGL